jgi:hypothetical protein
MYILTEIIYIVKNYDSCNQMWIQLKFNPYRYFSSVIADKKFRFRQSAALWTVFPEYPLDLYSSSLSCCWSAARGVSSLPLYGGGPPPPRLGVGEITPPFRRSFGRFLLWCCCYMGQMIYHLEGSLASSVHTGGLRYTDVFPLQPARHIAPVAWI